MSHALEIPMVFLYLNHLIPSWLAIFNCEPQHFPGGFLSSPKGAKQSHMLHGACIMTTWLHDLVMCAVNVRIYVYQCIPYITMYKNVNIHGAPATNNDHPRYSWKTMLRCVAACCWISFEALIHDNRNKSNHRLSARLWHILNIFALNSPVYLKQ